MLEKVGFVYIMMSLSGVVYVGVTSDLAGRVWEHKSGIYEGFTKKYNCHKLVYYEIFEDILSAIQREKQLKSWKRKWKLDLITANNPKLIDFYKDIAEGTYHFFDQGLASPRS